MKSLSVLTLAAIALAAAVLPASSEVIMTLSTGRDYKQRTKFVTDFRGGDLFVSFRDGNAILAPCPHPSSFIIDFSDSVKTSSGLMSPATTKMALLG